LQKDVVFIQTGDVQHGKRKFIHHWKLRENEFYLLFGFKFNIFFISVRVDEFKV